MKSNRWKHWLAGTVLLSVLLLSSGIVTGTTAQAQNRNRYSSRTRDCNQDYSRAQYRNDRSYRDETWNRQREYRASYRHDRADNRYRNRSYDRQRYDNEYDYRGRHYENYRRDRSWQEEALIIGGSAAAGAGIGALAGGKKGAIIGAAVGGGAGLVYDLLTRRK